MPLSENQNLEKDQYPCKIIAMKKAGGDKVKAVFQLGVILPAINSKSYFDVNSSSIFVGPLLKFAIGINYTFGKKNTGK